MKPLTRHRQIPANSKQYFSISLGEEVKVTYWFKNPYYGIGATLLQLISQTSALTKDDDNLQAKAINMLPAAGATIGLAWASTTHDLETKLPVKYDVDSLREYGNQVACELQDADINLLDMIDLFGRIAPELQKRQYFLEMAKERVNFIDPHKAD